MSEYIFGYEKRDYGDIAAPARRRAAATSSAGARRCRSIDPGQRIRATVIGASQFTVQVSGKTIYLPDPGVLPVHNVPVVHVGLDLAGAIDADGARRRDRARASRRLDLEPEARMAIAFAWHGDPEYRRARGRRPRDRRRGRARRRARTSRCS